MIRLVLKDASFFYLHNIKNIACTYIVIQEQFVQERRIMGLEKVKYMNGYKVINYIVPITKEEEEEIALSVYRILTKDDKMDNKEVM